MVASRFRSRSPIILRYVHKILILALLLFGVSVVAQRSKYDNNHRSRVQKLIFLVKGGSSSITSNSPTSRPIPLKPSIPIVTGVSNQDTRGDVLPNPKTENGKPVYWPPWPFSVLNKNNQASSSLSPIASKAVTDFQARALLFATYTRQRARLGLQQIQQVGSAISFHLPAASPPLILLAVLPNTKQIIEASGGDTAATTLNTMANSFGKKLALTSFGVSVLTWAEYEIRRKRRLTPLPLDNRYKDFQRVVLPPFLPEASPPIEDDAILNSFKELENRRKADKNTDEETDEGTDKGGGILQSNDNDRNDNDKTDIRENDVLNALKQTFKHVIKTTTDKYDPLFVAKVRSMWRIRRREEEEVNRKLIMDELLTIQQMKKGDQQKRSWGNSKGNNENLGYALVTGASKGIGRAIAVELARWEIPLLLVARDLEKLTALADELVACYGIDCHVLSADLSKPGVAEQVYRATKDVNMRVDILVNNCGVCTKGEMMDSREEDIRRMIDVNVGTVTELSHLYGRDMKSRRRGRILFVSSITGSAPGGPSVATYSATKAYEKSLALSLGKELERFGVGVTCVMPGAVRGTAFAAESNIENAACYKIPFYAMTASSIASRSVRALLAGDAEIIPGWHNRSFIKIAAPLLPQRLTTSVVQFAFSPLELPWAKKNIEESEDSFPDDSKARIKRLLPRQLTLPKAKENLADDSLVQSSFSNIETSDALQSENAAKDGASDDIMHSDNVDGIEGTSIDELQPGDGNSATGNMPQKESCPEEDLMESCMRRGEEEEDEDNL